MMSGIFFNSLGEEEKVTEYVDEMWIYMCWCWDGYMDGILYSSLSSFECGTFYD